MFQNQAMLWLLMVASSTLPLATSPDPMVRDLGFKDLFAGVFGGNPVPNWKLPSSQKPIFASLFGSGNAGAQKTGWPDVQVKFNHPIQSPVDFITSKSVPMALPTLNIVEPQQQNVKAKFYNSGHTVYVFINEDPSLRPYLKGGPLNEKYIFEQLHFHWGSEDIWGSEHFIDGESYAVEIHMVHFNSKYKTFKNAASQPDGLAVLTVFAEACEKDNELIEPLYTLLPQIAQPNTSVELDSVKGMQWAVSGLSVNHYYYTYPGSLTTEPYSENVTWILLPKAIPLSHTQLAAFREILSEHHEKILENKRKLQPLHNRPLVRSTSLH